VFTALQLVAALSVGSLILGALGYRVTRRKAKTSQHREHQVREIERKERVSHKAAQRLELESEVKRIMAEHRANMSAQQRPENYGDDLTEVDLTITHGRYQRAELMLKEVLREAPRNVDAKLRLADVYYVTEQVEAFLRIAQDLRAHHRHEIADDDWQKVVRMGRVLRPDDSLFGRLNEVPREMRTA
jgi:Tfp pilus assembly protein FimV